MSRYFYLFPHIFDIKSYFLTSNPPCFTIKNKIYRLFQELFVLKVNVKAAKKALFPLMENNVFLKLL